MCGLLLSDYLVIIAIIVGLGGILTAVIIHHAQKPRSNIKIYMIRLEYHNDISGIIHIYIKNLEFGVSEKLMMNVTSNYKNIQNFKNKKELFLEHGSSFAITLDVSSMLEQNKKYNFTLELEWKNNTSFWKKTNTKSIKFGLIRHGKPDNPHAKIDSWW